MQSIPKLLEKINRLHRCARDIDEKILLIGILMLSSFLAFALGRLSALNPASSDIMVEEQNFNALPASVYASQQNGGEVESLKTGGMVVGSKNSDKYHLPWCSGAQRIKEGNKITFATVQEAEAAGYKPAGNCPGLSE